MKQLVAISLLGLLAVSSSKTGAFDAEWQPSSQANEWHIGYSPGIPAHPKQEGMGWKFWFPEYDGPFPCKDSKACPRVAYMTTRALGPLRAHSIKITVEIKGSARFQARLGARDTPRPQLA